MYPSSWGIPPYKTRENRVVFDCVVQFESTSLNDQLMQGPEQLITLIGVLCSFRKDMIASMCACYEVAFGCKSMQISLSLWAEGDDRCGDRDSRAVILKKRRPRNTRDTDAWCSKINKVFFVLYSSASLAGTSKPAHKGRVSYFMWADMPCHWGLRHSDIGTRRN